MYPIRKHSILLLAFAALLAGLPAYAQAPAGEGSKSNLDAPLARIGDDIITQGQYLRELGFNVRQTMARTGKPFQPDQRFRTETFNAMVQARILGILARNAGVTVADADVEQEFERRRALIPTEEAFEEYLTKEQLTKETLLEEIRRRMILEAYVEQETTHLEVTEAETKAQYDKWNKEGLTRRKTATYDIGLILVQPAELNDEGWSMAELIVNDAHHRIQEGEAFEEVAREVSSDLSAAERGGIFEETFAKEFLPVINETILSLEPGTLSEPFKSELGWHLIKLIAKNEPGVIPYEKVKPRLESFLLEQERKEFLRNKVTEAQTYIDVEVVKQADSDSPGPQ